MPRTTVHCTRLFGDTLSLSLSPLATCVLQHLIFIIYLTLSALFFRVCYSFMVVHFRSHRHNDFDISLCCCCLFFGAPHMDRHSFEKLTISAAPQ